MHARSIDRMNERTNVPDLRSEQGPCSPALFLPCPEDSVKVMIVSWWPGHGDRVREGGRG